MKVGDLVREYATGDVGIIVRFEVSHLALADPDVWVRTWRHQLELWPRHYVEVISEAKIKLIQIEEKTCALVKNCDILESLDKKCEKDQ